MKKIVTLAMVVLVATSALIGCKKGANDPFLSLKSRKARLKGDWKLVQVEGKGVGTNGAVTTVFYDGTLWTETTNGSSNSYLYEKTITFDKKGTFKFETKSTYSENKFDQTVVEGKWAFIGKNKDASLKNKEAITFAGVKWISSGQTEDTMGNIVTYNSTNITDGNFANRVWYGWILDKLSSKEMIVKTNYSYTDEAGKSTIEYTYTYEKQ